MRKRKKWSALVGVSTEAIWQEMKRLYRAHDQVILALAGVFLFLPGLAANLFLDEPQLQATTIEAFARAINTWVLANWKPLVLEALVSAFGSAVLYRYCLSKASVTAQQAIVEAIPLLPIVLVASLVTSLAIMSGLYLFVLPGVYLCGRLLLASPIIIAESETNIFSAIARSIKLTRGVGWRLVGMLALMVMMIFIIMLISSAVIGILFRALLPSEGLALVDAALASVQMTIFNVATLLMAAASYRLLSDTAAHQPTTGI
jgi:Membrane domain of glycerophosphoryl diester phosphodiesterase/Uncharacterised protein family (UPF0259)